VIVSIRIIPRNVRLAGLIDKGLVYRPERGRLAFTVPLFGDYLRRHHI